MSEFLDVFCVSQIKFRRSKTGRVIITFVGERLGENFRSAILLPEGDERETLKLFERIGPNALVILRQSYGVETFLWIDAALGRQVVEGYRNWTDLGESTHTVR